MICENCKTKIEENSKTCPNCGVIVKPNVIQHNQNIIVEQPVVNQVIEEEHKDKMTKKSRNQIILVTSLLFFALTLGAFILSNWLPKEKNNDMEISVPIPSVTEVEEQEKIDTILYNGYKVAYQSDYNASIEEGLLLLENEDLYFQLTIHPNVTKEMFEQSKNDLKQLLLNNGYILEGEETTIRSGIEFYLIKLYNIVDNKKSDYEYFLSIDNNNLYEIMVLEINEGNYSKISKQLRTIVRETKNAN